MAINPENIDITKLSDLPNGAFNLLNYIAQSNASGLMTKGTQSDFAAFIAPYAAAIGSSGYVNITSNTLPNPSGSNSFSIVSSGTYNQTGEAALIATGDFNIIYWNGTTWTLTKAIDVDLSDTAKLEELPLSKNIFDKNKATIGFYTEYQSGNLVGNSGFFTSDFIEITPGVNYSVSYDGNPDGNQMAFFKPDKTYHSGLAQALSFVAPVGAGYCRINSNLSHIDTEQFEQSLYPTSFQAYSSGFGIEKATFNINTKYSNTQKKQLVVAKTGGDFAKIQDAINASNGSTNSPTDIIICSGVYLENLNTVGKNLSLRGVNKHGCIIKTVTGNYFAPPLECSGGTYAENLTFLATSENPDVHDINAYGVHMDFPGEGVTEFFNCYIESQQNSAMGIGLHQNQKLIINNCELVQNQIGELYVGGALYFHNSPSAESGQKLIVKNTLIKCDADTGPAIKMDDARANAGGVDIDTTVSFYNTIAFSKQFGKGAGSFFTNNLIFSGPGTIQLTPDSFGNNLAILNA